MKIKELRELEEGKLQKALEDAKKDLIQLGKSSKKRNVRRQIARMLTIMNERKKGITPKVEAMSEAHGTAGMEKKEEKKKGEKGRNLKEKTAEKPKQKKKSLKTEKRRR